MSEVVLSEIGDGIATLTINRPDQRNALTGDVLRGLTSAFHGFRHDESVRAVVLTGSGDRAFCAGADLAEMVAPATEVERHQARGLFVETFMAAAHLGKPLIGAVNGHALGGGFGLALCCDLLVAADNATFGTPEITVGLWPMVIMPVITRNLGRKRAMELMMTGRRISAATAEQWGFVNTVVAQDQVLSVALRWASDIGRWSPLVISMGRDAFYGTADLGLEDALRFLHGQFTILSLSADSREGVSAFVEKRQPKFAGH